MGKSEFKIYILYFSCKTKAHFLQQLWTNQRRGICAVVRDMAWIQRSERSTPYPGKIYAMCVHKYKVNKECLSSIQAGKGVGSRENV